MTDIVSLILSFPTVALTVPLGLVLLYWLFVVLGALDIDAFHGADAATAGAKGALEGATKGVLEGATKGVLEGATKGVVEGAAKGVIEGAAKAGLEGAAGTVADSLGAEGAPHAADAPLVAARSTHEGGGPSTPEALRAVPATVTLSVWILLSWLLCSVGAPLLVPHASSWRWLVGSGLLIGSLLLAMAPTTWAIRPLGRLFRTRLAKGHQDLVGRTCRVTTGRVDARFGQAALEDGSLSLLVQVRHDGTAPIRKGERLLLVSWDAERNAFVVEPLEPLLAEQGPRGAAEPAEEHVEEQAGATVRHGGP